MVQDRNEYWFAGTGCGCGSGWPRSWQGWLIVAVYGGIVTVAALLLAERTPLGFAAIVIVATALLRAICSARTPGGLSWRLPPGMGGRRPGSPRWRR